MSSVSIDNRKRRNDAKSKKNSDAIDYLGHVIAPKRFYIATEKIDAVRNLKYPTTTTELRSFLELCSDCRQFVPNFSQMTALLNKRLKRGEQTTFELKDEERQTVEYMKEKLTTPAVLALPRSEGQLLIDTDACDKQVGCVLLQEQEESEIWPVGYWSRTSKNAEKSYNTAQKKFLAVIWSVMMLRPNVEGGWLITKTDHKSLKLILALKNQPAG